MKRILMPLCIVLAVLIILVSITTVTFSWFTPGSASGIGLQFTADTSVRSQNSSITTYIGENNNGVIVYGDAPVGSTETVSADGVAYFKTVIHNDNKKYDTNVSLYLSAFTLSGTECSASIGVATPTNTYRTFIATESDVHIIRNAYVSAYSANEAGSGSVSVEWFVKCDKGTATVNPSHVYLTYN